MYHLNFCTTHKAPATIDETTFIACPSWLSLCHAGCVCCLF